MPLPMLLRPWSHLTLDFITDLPPSEVMNAILVVLDSFSIFLRLIPLNKLFFFFGTHIPTGLLLFQHTGGQSE